jgi:hypothetical protein
MVMDGIHKIPRPEWVTRYAAEMWRRGAKGSIKELVAAGCTLWLSAGHRLPEAVALAQCQSLAVSELSPPSQSEPAPQAGSTRSSPRPLQGDDA